jgi:uncharacterized protein (DUF488 family)
MSAATAHPRIFTIGHSTRDFDEVLGMLDQNGVTELVDVRSLPGSRAFPQWDREAIEVELPERIGYRWAKDLGGRRRTRAGVESPNGWWRVRAFRDYADYMATPEFAAGLETLLELADTAVPAIMCSEAVPWRCHRRLITDAAIVAGAEVFHIMSPTHVERAELNPAMVLVDGVLTYPPEEAPAS